MILAILLLAAQLATCPIGHVCSYNEKGQIVDRSYAQATLPQCNDNSSNAPCFAGCFPQGEGTALACWNVLPGGKPERDRSNPLDTAVSSDPRNAGSLGGRATCETAVAFSPNGNAETVLVTAINRSRKSLYVAIYSITNPAIIDAFILAKKRGVDVSMKADQLQSNGKAEKSAIAKLKRAHIPVMISALRRTLHDKYAVVDDEMVATGSYNWTANAQTKNEENILILTCPWLAQLYKANWDTIK
jgi:phosphatidylserine/phosphatidylglycerophosphate/cardiolipin synthase-like enzyme